MVRRQPVMEQQDVEFGVVLFKLGGAQQTRLILIESFGDRLLPKQN